MMLQLQWPGAKTCFATLLNKDFEDATKIWITSPWLSDQIFCKLLVAMVQQESTSVKILTQIKDGQSEPDCLQLLCQGGVELLVWGTNHPQFFHPKIYLFSYPDRWIAWIGSANLTSNGLRRNIESMVRLELNSDEFRQWEKSLESLERYCRPLTEELIEKYRDERKQLVEATELVDDIQSDSLIHHLAPVEVDAVSSTDSPLLRWTWSEFVRSINQDPKRKEQSIGIMNAIKDMRAVLLSSPPWSEDKVKRIFGLEGGYLGNLIKNYSSNIQLFSDVVFQRKIHAIAKAPAYWKNNHDAFDGFIDLTKLHQFGCSTASKFAAVLAPGSITVINKKSRVRAGYLAHQSSLESSHNEYEGFRRFHELIWKTSWHQSQPPKDVFEHQIWEHRSALLDVFLADFMSELS